MKRCTAGLMIPAVAFVVLFATTKLYAASFIEICDQEAGYLSATSLQSVGVSWENLDPKKAIPACQKALQEKPDEPRVWLQLGRALLKAENYEGALMWFGRAANQGDADAQTNLGLMYDRGEGVPEDDKEAVRWYRMAAEQGDAYAQTNLGLMYDRGEGVPEDDKEAVRWFRKAAEQGDANAQINLGLMYDKGEGVPEDDKEAVRWFRKAAEQGDANAQINLGRMYQRGEGVTKDYEKAARWHRKAAEQGDAYAQYILGVMYDHGDGVPKDQVKSFQWQLKAAKQGYSDAQFNLGLMYDRGEGVPEDDKEAVRWYRMAAEQGDADAQNSVGWLYHQGIGTPRNYTKAREWYLKAAKDSNSYAQNNLGILYEKGQGVPVDYLEAAKWHRLSAEQENEWGLFHLGSLYRNGLGVERDYEKARKLYMKAANKGFIEAYLKLAEIFEYGLGVEKNLEESAQWLKKAETAPKEYEEETAAALGVMGHRKQAEIHLKNIEKILSDQRSLKAESGFPRYKDINFGTYYALVIGNNDYKHLENLETAVSDASAVAELLKNKYGFRVTLLTNATRKQISSELNRFRKRLFENDNLLIYYAGHGVYDEDTKTGYWQPVDAEKDDDTEWIANDRVTRVLKGLRSLNVMVVADSCYSGTVFRGVGSTKLTAETKGQMFKRLVEKKTRIALTSGGLEPVVDSIGGSSHSVFAGVFLKILKKSNAILTATRLYQELREQVIPIMDSNGVDQTPEYASLHKSGHDGGDFLFVPKHRISRHSGVPGLSPSKPAQISR
jgi:TPR repeat protein